jgi:hypothetical protein
MIGSTVWKWQDDHGTIHKEFVIPKAFFVKEGNIRLLSQPQNDTLPKQGTGSETVGDKVTLFWKQQTHNLTIPLNRLNNVATFNLAPGYTKFMGFCAEAEVDYAKEQDNPIICMPAQMVSND